MGVAFSRVQRWLQAAKNFTTGDARLESMSPGQETFLMRWLDKSAASPGGLPSRADFPHREFASILPNAVVYSIARSPLDFECRLIGTEVRSFSHADYTGSFVSSLDGKGRGSKLWQQLAHVVLAREPLYDRLPYMGPIASVRDVSVLLCPLSKSGQTVDQIFQVTQFVHRKSLAFTG